MYPSRVVYTTHFTSSFWVTRIFYLLTFYLEAKMVLRGNENNCVLAQLPSLHVSRYYRSVRTCISKANLSFLWRTKCYCKSHNQLKRGLKWFEYIGNAYVIPLSIYKGIISIRCFIWKRHATKTCFCKIMLFIVM